MKKQKLFPRFFLLTVGTLFLLLSCKKDDNSDPVTSATAKNPFATITLNRNDTDVTRWTYNTLDDKLNNIKWELLNPSMMQTTNTTVAYNGSKVSSLQVIFGNGNKENITIIYDGDKLTKITRQTPGQTQITNFEVEYDGQGRIVQVNKYRENNGAIQSISIFGFTYDEKNNISKLERTLTSQKTVYNITYDNKENKVYNSNDFLIVTIGEITGSLNHTWGITPAMLTLTANNVVSATVVGSNEKFDLTYTYDSNNNLSAVNQLQTNTSGTVTGTLWKITSK